ncbi:MAG: hypothetical protein WC341_09995 [Bacteroidales bacterium]|jgi:hypothetical protein
MKKFTVTNIKYDTDGEKIDLPDRLEIELPDDTEEDEVADLLSDEISNITGFCHFGFVIEGEDEK